MFASYLTRSTLLFAILKINNRKPYLRWRTERRPKGDRGTKCRVTVFYTVSRSCEPSVSWFAVYRMCNETVMHQSIPPAPSPPRATAGHLPALSVPGVGHLQMLHCPGAGHLQPRPQGFSLKKWAPHPFKGKALGTRLGHLPTPGPIPSF